MTPPLPEILRRLDNWYAQHTPYLFQTLRPGISEEWLAGYEASLGVPLPEDVRELYCWHGGGQYAFVVDFPHLLSEFGPHGLEDEEAGWAMSQPPGAVRQVAWSDRWHDLFGGDGSYIVVDLDPGPSGTYGQLVVVDRDHETRYVLAESLTAFLTEFLERLEGGRCVAEKNPPNTLESIYLLDRRGVRADIRQGIADLFPGFGAVPDSP
ncbi:SMI1/KNR4 family protein [Deinococcus proteolyticus]|nr:SMI1/KNR4 family protein [Deinococcus proteolyticus]